MRIESAVRSISWIPSEAIPGVMRLPFDIGPMHYDDPPGEQLTDIPALVRSGAVRFVNELRAWIDVDGGRIVAHGHLGHGWMGRTKLGFGSKKLLYPTIGMHDLRPQPEVGAQSVRFVQTTGGRAAVPLPRKLNRPPFVQIVPPVVWTTLALTLAADGSATHEVVGASPFPRHWIYDKDGKLVQKSGTIDFEQWYREAHGENTPWGTEDSDAFVTDAESALERELSKTIMRSDATSKPSQLAVDETLTEQGETGDGIYLLLDGILAVEVDGETLAQVGPGAILGARALVEGGRRTATLRAVTPAKVVCASTDDIEPSALEELAGAHRREEG